MIKYATAFIRLDDDAHGFVRFYLNDMTEQPILKADGEIVQVLTELIEIMGRNSHFYAGTLPGYRGRDIYVFQYEYEA